MNGRYSILATIASGGMGTVHLGRMKGSAGFARLVAIKQLNPHVASDPELVAALFDEATLAAQVRHPNVVGTVDVVTTNGTLSVIFDYVEGESLSSLIKLATAAGEPVMPRPIAIAIVRGALRGLDAAHDARGDDGTPLGIVHRDVSPQNILVGVDGLARVIDFGVAKALGRVGSTRPGEVRGKHSYMAPEQLMGRPVTRQIDVYAMGVVLWESLTGKRLFAADDVRAVNAAVIENAIERPSEALPDEGIEGALDEVVLRATNADLGVRQLTARELIADLEPFERASDDEVGAWVRRVAAQRLAHRAEKIRATPRGESLSIEELMRELSGQAAQPAPDENSGSVSAVAVPFSLAPPPSNPLLTAPAPERRSPGMAIGVAIAIGLLAAVAVMLILRGADKPAPPSAGAAPPVVVARTAPLPEPVASPSGDVELLELGPDVSASRSDGGARSAHPAGSHRPRRPSAPRPTASAADPRSYQ